MTKRQTDAMQQAIDAAWQDPAGAEFRERLFPEGKPTVDLFVERVAIFAQAQANSARDERRGDVRRRRG